MGVSEPESGENLLFQELILELLLSEDLATLLAASYQVWHYLLSWAEWQVLENSEAFSLQVRCELV